MAELIRIEGLRELNRGLRKLSAEAPKQLRIAGNAAAAIVVDEARPRVPVGPGHGGHARASLKAASTRTAARVSAGGNRYPYYPWLDFGGAAGRNKAVKRPFLKKGRYIWASFADRRDEVQAELRDGLTAAVRSAGLEVS